jgi:hypothetical protein
MFSKPEIPITFECVLMIFSKKLWITLCYLLLINILNLFLLSIIIILRKFLKALFE